MIVLTEEQVLIQKMAREFAMTTGIKKNTGSHDGICSKRTSSIWF